MPEREYDAIIDFCDRCIPEGAYPDPDVWRFVYALRFAATVAWMYHAAPEVMP